ncbi:MAG TPA: cytochrome c oxidase assembly protein [Longimicrobiales bacterium]|nr:cytochrome c oxidase assembly protein [Longimicrobiales bacterium]
MGDLQAFLLSWSFEPTVVVGLALGAWLYIRGWRTLRRRGRGGRSLRPWRAWCYAAGLATVAIALLSPIATFTPLFFFMHMIQHVLLVMVAAPLLLLGAPVVPTMWALPRDARHAVGRIFRRDHPVHRVFHFLTKPPVALALFVLTLVGWHHPALYDAAQGRSLIHDMEHALFFGTALLFWWPVIHPTGGRRRLAYGAGILYIFPAKLAGFALGAFLTLTGTPYYQTYVDAPRLWGISALGDQQLGGLIMWVLGGLIYIVPVLALVMMMMRDDEGHVWVPEAIRDRDAVPLAGGERPVAETGTV